MPLADFEAHFLAVDERESAVVARVTRAQLGDEENIEQMGLELFALVDQYDCRTIVCDLSAVEYMTSSAVGKLISLHRKLGRIGGRLVLCHIRPAIHEILDTARLLGYFQTADDVDAALAMIDGGT